MKQFLAGFSKKGDITDLVLKAGVAHLGLSPSIRSTTGTDASRAPLPT